MAEPTSGAGEPIQAPRPTGVLDDWGARLARALSVGEAPVDVPLLLDVARDVAHAVDRPAVPITMYLLGYASARGGGGQEAVDRASAETLRLAEQWAVENGRRQGT